MLEKCVDESLADASDSPTYLYTDTTAAKERGILETCLLFFAVLVNIAPP